MKRIQQTCSIGKLAWWLRNISGVLRSGPLLGDKPRRIEAMWTQARDGMGCLARERAERRGCYCTQQEALHRYLLPVVPGSSKHVGKRL